MKDKLAIAEIGQVYVHNFFIFIKYAMLLLYICKQPAINSGQQKTLNWCSLMTLIAGETEKRQYLGDV